MALKFRGLAARSAFAACLLSPAVIVWAQAGPVAVTMREEAEHDRRATLDRLGIEALAPGPNGDEKAPDHANYNEASANPHSELPDLLTTATGRRIATADQWWKQRRPEIADVYEREVYGRVPADAPRIDWRVETTDREFVGFTPVVARRVIGQGDNARTSAIKVAIRMVVVTPAAAKGPVPVLIMFGPDDFPAPAQPSRDEFARIDAAMKAALIDKDPALAAVFAEHPAFTLAQAPPFRFPQRDAHGDLPRPDQLIAAGWGYAMLDPSSIQADNAEGLRQGVIGLAARGKARRPDDWGVLRAWGWGASRALDFLAADPAIDAKRIGIEGVSRYGKAALVAAAFDRRFAVVLAGSSGKGGTTLLRRNYGEAVANLATGGYHWMAGNFLKYGAARMKNGARPLTAADLPVDAHALIALVAPRPLFISYGIPEQGDAHWLDHRGSWMAAVAAGSVYRLLGAKDLGVGDDYRNAAMPPVNIGLLDGALAWRQHDAGHVDSPNIGIFAGWADRQTGRR